MSTISKFAGLIVGVSAVATLGIAIAQGQPPNPYIANHAIGAGQQNLHMAPMGETGVLTQAAEIRTAAIYVQPEVAVVQQPAPVVAEAPVQQTQTVAMGAAPAEPARAPKQDRN
ncbi:MAG: hypothetical protein H7255_07715 [Ramlibacter sp.]|nr:hypothetical protein [Ramlibacter sp.]